jgi:hypothetical protein
MSMKPPKNGTGRLSLHLSGKNGRKKCYHPNTAKIVPIPSLFIACKARILKGRRKIDISLCLSLKKSVYSYQQVYCTTSTSFIA